MGAGSRVAGIGLRVSEPACVSTLKPGPQVKLTNRDCSLHN